MKTSIRSLFLSLLALVLMAAAKPTADQKLAAEWFSFASVKNLATTFFHEYRYSSQTGSCTTRSCWDNPNAVSYELRASVLKAKTSHSNGIPYSADPGSPQVNALRQRYKREVKAFVSRHPKLLEPLYIVLADLTITEMITLAQADGKDAVWTAGMFEAYAGAIEKGIPYLRLALQTASKRVKDDLTFIDSKAPAGADAAAEKAYWQKTIERKEGLLTHLQETTGLPFDQNAYETWRFGLRRVKDKSLPVVIELAEDAVKRARAKAAELRGGVPAEAASPAAK